jgi:hypothetical protein
VLLEFDEAKDGQETVAHVNKTYGDFKRLNKFLTDADLMDVLKALP